MSYETLNKALGRIVELEAALSHQTKCREDSDRKLMAADDMLNATAYQLAEAREDFGHSESERCELRAALRDTIEALGGVAAPGVSVQFLKLAPQEAESVKKQMAEAREDAARYQYIRTEAMIDYCTGSKRHNRISWPTIYAAAPADGGNYRDRFDAAIDAARGLP